ncbi:MAG TPA: vitamin B12-dependent ribonucleotide reductase, partial [Candidatus Binatia bacterium]|nr:vitamin B12-dependent ribonucleotide reductase [Candidatus Binatia bacterium]
SGLPFEPVFNMNGDPFESVTWETRDACITGAKGDVVFEQKGMRFPADWTQTSVNITASKYFYGKKGSAERESGVDQLVRRVVSTIKKWGIQSGYFKDEKSADVFANELAWLLLNQYASFNSPVWFNVGCDLYNPISKSGSWHWDPDGASILYEKDGYNHPQCSACFINAVEDSMESILELAKTEGLLFKFGSGTGTNLSTLRASIEGVNGGGVASGPLSFMRGYDAFAGVIKSGGKTRRAAKMVILNSDHPDIEAFITCKGKEEAKARALMAMGYDGSGPDSEAYSSIYYQNANNSVRASDKFMNLASGAEKGDHELTARTDGRVIRTVSAEELLTKIAEETWKCGDPGMQFDDTINKWHTCKTSGRINASNPCSEYMFLDNSACNLASFNLVKFLRKNGTFDEKRLRAAVHIFIVAQDILVDHSGYPTRAIATNSHDYRPLGLGYANLGALLLRMGLPYDSDEGRDIAAAVTAIMGGQAYLTSAELAMHMSPVAAANSELESEPSEFGAFPGYQRNRESFLNVIDMHLKAAERLQDVPGDLKKIAVSVWSAAYVLGSDYGYRNAQTTVLAPTGTIGFMMDCDSTGIEPMVGLIYYKKLVGGGTLPVANASVPVALDRLGYSPEEIERLSKWIAEHGTIEGAEELKAEHLAIFDCAMKPKSGSRTISWMGHVKMMAATQPFLSGAISKTVNVPTEFTAEDIKKAYIESWRLGLKAIAIYRDGSKGGQPISLDKDSAKKEAPAVREPEEPLGPPRAVRNRLPVERMSLTHKFSIGGHEGYLTVGLYPNGKPGEIFIKMAKEGSTISGLMDSFATSVSLALQSGVPLKAFCDKFTHMRFEPSGWTGNEQLGYAKSLMDYIFRWLELRFLKGEQLSMFTNMATPAAAPPVVAEPAQRSITDMLDFGDSPTCTFCGSIMVRNGSCHKCEACGSTSGCS